MIQNLPFSLQTTFEIVEYRCLLINIPNNLEYLLVNIFENINITHVHSCSRSKFSDLEDLIFLEKSIQNFFIFIIQHHRTSFFYPLVSFPDLTTSKKKFIDKSIYKNILEIYGHHLRHFHFNSKVFSGEKQRHGDLKNETSTSSGLSSLDRHVGNDHPGTCVEYRSDPRRAARTCPPT